MTRFSHVISSLRTFYYRCLIRLRAKGEIHIVTQLRILFVSRISFLFHTLSLSSIVLDPMINISHCSRSSIIISSYAIRIFVTWLPSAFCFAIVPALKEKWSYNGPKFSTGFDSDEFRDNYEYNYHFDSADSVFKQYLRDFVEKWLISLTGNHS